MLAYASSPYIITTWIGGPVSNSLLQGAGWRWGFGIFSIVVPVVVAPLCILFFWNHRKAKKVGLIKSSTRNLTLKSVGRYCIDVDLLGIIILAGGMALFLLPFSLWSYQKDGWRSKMIICMIIFGGLLLIAFALYEKWGAPVTFIPFKLLTDRTVFFAGMMYVFVFVNSTVRGSYYNSMLQVTHNLNVTQASYVGAIYRVGSCLWSIVMSFLIRWTGRFKWVALYFSIPLMMLGVGLLIKFRFADTYLGYIIMTQIFIAFAGGPIVVSGELAMMVPSDHQHVAVVIAILDMFSSIGSSIGSTVSAAIWTGTFPVKLQQFTPEGTDIKAIYSDIQVQKSYPVGTPTRDGINLAYSESQRYMLITSVCLLVGALASAAMWRDLKLKDAKQVRGRVA